MRLAVRTSLATLLLLFSLIHEAQADTVADCDDPPGGRITCEAHQAAFCKVKQGRVDGYCRKPPTSLSQAEISAWALTNATGKEVSSREIESVRYQLTLKYKRFERNDGTVVTFTLPGDSPKRR